MVGRLKDQHILSKRETFSRKTSDTSKSKESLITIKQKQQEQPKDKREDLVDLSEQAKRALELLKNAKNISQELKLQNIDNILSLKLINLATGLRYLLQEQENDSSNVWKIKDFEAMSLDIIDSVSAETVKLDYQSVTAFYIKASHFRFAPRIDNKGYDLVGFECDLFIMDDSQTKDFNHCKSWFCSLPPYTSNVPPLTQDYTHLLQILHNVFFGDEVESKQEQNFMYLLTESIIFDSSQPLAPLTLGGITLKMLSHSDKDQISLTL